MQNHERTSSVAAAYAHRIALVATVLVASASLTQRAEAQDESAPAPSQSAVDSTRAYAAPSSVWNAQRVKRVLQDGTHIVLTDGTIWEVYLPDRPAVNTWKPGDLLIVREAAVSQGDYDYTLKDGRTRRAVSARLVGDSN
ncbi:MAG: hypothetical protein M3Y30_10390 [Gemmatimonadota bacterium]|nr:hypothetical protein [Gemmatimonadota bacterium]